MIRLDDHRIALERVRDYLEREYFSREISEGVKLPSVREVAKAVGASNAAVYTVYRELQENGRVVSVIGRGTFVTPGSQIQRKLQLALVLPGIYRENLTDGECDWQNTVIGGLLAVAAEYPEATVRCMWAAQFLGTEEEQRITREEVNELDGGILLQMHAREIEAVQFCFRETGKPYVTINPPEPFQTANFVSSDYYRFGLEMGRVWLESGRHHLLLIAGEPDTPSWIQRLAGFQAAAGKHQECLRIHYCGRIQPEDGERGMREVLESGYRPDAVFAFGDLLAYGVRQTLLAAGFSIPGEVSIVGGTGMDGMRKVGLSTHCNDYLGIARAALRMIIARIRSGGESQPACYIPIGFTPAKTTRPLETTLWKRYHR